MRRPNYQITVTLKDGTTIDVATAEDADKLCKRLGGSWACAPMGLDRERTAVTRLERCGGFSLVELMVAVTIIAVLGTVAVASAKGIIPKVKVETETRMMLAAMLMGERTLYAQDNGQVAKNGITVGASMGSENGTISNCYLPDFLYTPNANRYMPIANQGSGHCADLYIAADSPLYCFYGTWTSWNSAALGYTYLNTAFCDVDGDGVFHLKVQAVDDVQGELKVVGTWEYDDVRDREHMRSIVLFIGAVL